MLATLMMISAKDEEREREQQKEERCRDERRHAASMCREWHHRTQPTDKRRGEGAEQWDCTTEEWCNEQEPDDRPHISHCRADAGKPPAFLWRHQLRHHGVIERLSRLIRIVGNYERHDHPAESANARVPIRGEPATSNDLFASERERGLAN